jgi:hypothetical protein
MIVRGVRAIFALVCAVPSVAAAQAARDTVAKRDSAPSGVSMSQRVTTLSPVEIRERAHFDLVRSEINQRRRAGFGYRSDSIELARLPGVREAFNFPGVHFGGTPANWGIFMTGVYSLPTRNGGPVLSCTPTIWIDGAVADMAYLRDLAKEEIAMIEVYRTGARTPMQFAGRDNCGVVLVWRKQYVNPP